MAQAHIVATEFEDKLIPYNFIFFCISTFPLQVVKNKTIQNNKEHTLSTLSLHVNATVSYMIFIDRYF